MAAMFGHGEAVFRDRRPLKADPYNPGRQVPGSWDDELDTKTLTGCYVATTSTSLIPNNARREGVIYKSLFIPGAGADIKTGDRIRTIDPEGREYTYEVGGIPAADTNPFTGWRPVLEVPLEGFQG